MGSRRQRGRKGGERWGRAGTTCYEGIMCFCFIEKEKIRKESDYMYVPIYIYLYLYTYMSMITYISGGKWQNGMHAYIHDMKHMHS